MISFDSTGTLYMLMPSPIIIQICIFNDLKKSHWVITLYKYKLITKKAQLLKEICLRGFIYLFVLFCFAWIRCNFPRETFNCLVFLHCTSSIQIIKSRWTDTIFWFKEISYESYESAFYIIHILLYWKFLGLNLEESRLGDRNPVSQILRWLRQANVRSILSHWVISPALIKNSSLQHVIPSYK